MLHKVNTCILCISSCSFNHFLYAWTHCLFNNFQVFWKHPVLKSIQMADFLRLFILTVLCINTGMPRDCHNLHFNSVIHTSNSRGMKLNTSENIVTKWQEYSRTQPKTSKDNKHLRSWWHCVRFLFLSDVSMDTQLPLFCQYFLLALNSSSKLIMPKYIIYVFWKCLIVLTLYKCWLQQN